MPQQDGQINAKNQRDFFHLVAELINRMVNTSTFLEGLKIDLFQNHMFSPYVAFNYVDFYGQGYITRADFATLISKNGIKCSENSIDFLLYVKSQKHSFSSTKT